MSTDMQDLQAFIAVVRAGGFREAARSGRGSAYLDAHGRPEHPRHLLEQACLRVQSSGGAAPPWEFERDGEVVRIDPQLRAFVDFVRASSGRSKKGDNADGL